jgi:ribonucleoside-triphosphate reductase
MLDKMFMMSTHFATDMLDGGSSGHLNSSEHLSKEQYMKLLNYAGEVGCSYWTINVPNTECCDCGYIAKHPFDTCPKCGSKNVQMWDRVIGYLTKIKNWSEGRRIEQKTRVYLSKENTGV